MQWFSQISAQVTAWYTQCWTMRCLSSSRIFIVFYDPQSLLIKEGAPISHCILRWYTTTLISVNLLHNLIILSKRIDNSFGYMNYDERIVYRNIVLSHSVHLAPLLYTWFYNLVTSLLVIETAKTSILKCASWHVLIF